MEIHDSKISARLINKNRAFLNKGKILGFLSEQLKKHKIPLFAALFVLLTCNVIMLYYMHEPWRDEAQA